MVVALVVVVVVVVVCWVPLDVLLLAPPLEPPLPPPLLLRAPLPPLFPRKEVAATSVLAGLATVVAATVLDSGP